MKRTKVRAPLRFLVAATLSATRIGTRNRKRQQAGRTPNASRSSVTLSLAREHLECAELAPAFAAASWKVVGELSRRSVSSIRVSVGERTRVRRAFARELGHYLKLKEPANDNWHSSPGDPPWV